MKKIALFRFLQILIRLNVQCFGRVRWIRVITKINAIVYF